MYSPSAKEYRTGQTIFREGEGSSCMYLIKKGTVSIRKMRGSAFVEIAKVYQNEVIGELSFFDRQPRSATAVAATDVELLTIEFSSLDKVYFQVPDYLKSIIVSVANRLRKANETVRRLQKNVSYDDESPAQDETKKDGDVDAFAILAATQDIARLTPEDLAQRLASVTSQPGETPGDDKNKP